MASGVCTVCGGAKKEHFDSDGNPTRIHVYTEVEGDLATKQQKEGMRISQPSPVAGMMMNMGANPVSLGRLVEILMERGLILSDEALYIAGMGPKPMPPQPSGYRDPAHPFYQPTPGAGY